MTFSVSKHTFEIYILFICVESFGFSQSLLDHIICGESKKPTVFVLPELLTTLVQFGVEFNAVLHVSSNFQVEIPERASKVANFHFTIAC